MTVLQQLAAAQANAEVVVNEIADTLSAAGIFGRRHPATAGLTWGYYGGYYASTLIADGTVALTASATNHIVVNRTTGAVSVATATTNWDNTATYGRLYKVTTGASGITAVEDHRFGATGIFASGSAGDPAGTAAAAVAAHEAAADPHTGYVLESALAESVDDRVAALLVAGSNVTLNYDDGANTLTVAATGAASPTTTKGDLIARSTTVDTRLPIGSNGQVLTADSAETLGVKWATPAAGGSTQGKHSAWIAAGSMRPASSNGCAALAAVAAGSGQPDIASLDFDATAQEFAHFCWKMPKSSDETAGLSFRAVWKHAATATNFGVAWEVQALAVGDGENIAQNFGTAATVTDTGGNTNYAYTSAESASLTPAGTWAEGDVLFFRVARAPANGSDTLAIDGGLIGIEMSLMTNADTDA